MINITVKPDAIELDGHALFNPGNDIVCAGVSALVQTFVLSVEELTTVDVEVQREALSGYIEAIRWERASPAFATLRDGFLIGIQSIAESYPNNVKVSIED